MENVFYEKIVFFQYEIFNYIFLKEWNQFLLKCWILNFRHKKRQQEFMFL